MDINQHIPVFSLSSSAKEKDKHNRVRTKLYKMIGKRQSAQSSLSHNQKNKQKKRVIKKVWHMQQP